MSYAGVMGGLYWLKDKLAFLKPLFPAALRRKVFSTLNTSAINRLPSRLYLHTDIVPALAAAGARKMLFVGCRAYNTPVYETCAARGIEVWSIDLDPASAPYGAPQGHFIGDVRTVDRLAEGLVFDAIIFNGILGFGIDGPDAAAESLTAFTKIACGNALLVVGWNPGRTDAAAIQVFRNRLVPTRFGNLPATQDFPAVPRVQPTPHRYEFYRLAGTAA